MCTHFNEGFELAREIHQQQSDDFKADFDRIEKIYDKLYKQREILEILENANQGGLLTFQRGAEKLKGRQLDNDTILDGAQTYGAFFVSFYQTASFLKKRFENAAVVVGAEYHHNGNGHSEQAVEDILRAS